MNGIHTPFPTTGYIGPEYFCEREEELATLIRNMKDGNPTTLIGIRRMGKTSLIHHLFHHLQSSFSLIYLDIMPTESLGELLNQFTSSVAASIPEKSTLGKRIWTYIRSLRPEITYDTLQGTPLIRIKASADQSKQSIGELFSILENQSRPIVIAIDEFQQILSYPEQKTEAWLKSIITKLNNVNFIFAGSQQHPMQELFTNPERPFFRSTQFLKIGKLPHSTYREFIIEKFARHSKILSDEKADEMLYWADNHTYYVQLLCNRTFIASGKKIDTETWSEEAARMLKEQESIFYNYRRMLTKPQWNLLLALAREGVVYQPTSSPFILQHELGNPATVLRSLNSLQKKGLVHRETGGEGNPCYGVCDILFRRWIDKKSL